jgi:Fur family ferric uptake transcriptional regulator
MVHRRPANYHTRQGLYILDYMKSLGDNHATAGQIVRHFEDTKELIGQTTVYRHLERLAAEGKIRKYILHNDKSACYQYIDNEVKCREHFHLKCESCGALIHMDCGFLNEIERHIFDKHKFQINMLKTVFYGICKKCLTGARREVKP